MGCKEHVRLARAGGSLYSGTFYSSDWLKIAAIVFTLTIVLAEIMVRIVSFYCFDLICCLNICTIVVFSRQADNDINIIIIM